jgi:hypothetical protein
VKTTTMRSTTRPRRKFDEEMEEEEVRSSQRLAPTIVALSPNRTPRRGLPRNEA